MTSRAQIELEGKEMPTSGSPVSDVFIDQLKKLASRAQVEGQPGHPISEAIIELSRFLSHPSSRAQV